MKDIAVADVRSFALMGHTGSGKTVLTDALLLKMGINDRLGSVDAGSSMSDSTVEEKERKISIFSSPFSGSHKTGTGRQIAVNVIDTPGYMDFYGQVVAASRSVETGLIVVDASSGVQVGTRRAWKLAVKQGLSRAIVITGLDRDNTDFAKTLEDVQTAFGNNCVPVVLPAADGGVVDILGVKHAPDDVAAQVEEIKGSLVELAAETDDTLIEKFLGGEDLSPDEIGLGLREAVSSGGLVPVFVCCALKDLGVSELLDGAARLLPSPEANARKDNHGEPIPCGASDPFVGLVWRTVNDPFVGQLTFLRVMGGTIKSDSEVSNSAKDVKERVGSLLLVNGKKQVSVDSATAGDVVAIPKLKHTTVGDTLCTVGTSVTCRHQFPQPGHVPGRDGQDAGGRG